MRAVFVRFCAAVAVGALASNANANQFNLGPFRQRIDFAGGEVAVELGINQTVVGSNEIRLRGVLRAEAEKSVIFGKIEEALRGALPLRKTYVKKLGFLEIAECDFSVDRVELARERLVGGAVDVDGSVQMHTGGFNCPYASSRLAVKVRFGFTTRPDSIGLRALGVEVGAPTLRGLGRLLGDEYLARAFKYGVTASVKTAATRFSMRFPTLEAFEGAYLGARVAASGDKLVVSVAFKGRLKDAATTQALRNGGFDLSRVAEFAR